MGCCRYDIGIFVFIKMAENDKMVEHDKMAENDKSSNDKMAEKKPTDQPFAKIYRQTQRHGLILSNSAVDCCTSTCMAINQANKQPIQGLMRTTVRSQASSKGDNQEENQACMCGLPDALAGG